MGDGWETWRISNKSLDWHFKKKGIKDDKDVIKEEILV